MQTQRVNIGAESRYWALSPGCPIVGKRDTSFLPRFCGLTAALEFPPGSGRHKFRDTTMATSGRLHFHCPDLQSFGALLYSKCRKRPASRSRIGDEIVDTCSVLMLITRTKAR